MFANFAGSWMRRRPGLTDCDEVFIFISLALMNEERSGCRNAPRSFYVGLSFVTLRFYKCITARSFGGLRMNYV